MARFVQLISIPLLLIMPVLGLSADNNKLIALTFDDGPRPYVLLGPHPQPVVGLLDLLDQHDIKATFFFVGWRLDKTPGPACREVGNSTDCRLAAEETHHRGHEIENHTLSHISFNFLRDKYGEDKILKDIDEASIFILSFTGAWPRYVRPPNWVIWQELRKQIEFRGYRVMVKPTKGIREPLVTQDVDSEDYLCAGANPINCPKPSLEDSILRKIEGREKKGTFKHILVFHELPVSVATLSTLIPELKARGYAFEKLDKYMETVKKEAK